jgi:hypothetical protein
MHQYATREMSLLAAPPPAWPSASAPRRRPSPPAGRSTVSRGTSSRPDEANLCAAHPPPGRARAHGAGQTPGREGIWRQRPQLQQTKPRYSTHVMHVHFMDTYKLSTFAGAMHRTLVGSRVRQHDAAPHRHGVQESLRNTAHTHKQCTARKVAKRSTGDSGRERDGGGWHGRLAELASDNPREMRCCCCISAPRQYTS